MIQNIKTAKANQLFIIFFVVVSFMAISQFGLVASKTQEINYSTSSWNYRDATFFVKVLKYEPYPVSVGDWFDLWIKVQNVGQNDAKNAEFKLIPEFPFSVQGSLVKNYKLISGTINAYKQMMPDDTHAQANQIILKYRVYVDPSAIGGKYILKIKTTADGNTYSTYNLPIEVAKSKVNFSIVFQNYNGAQSSFIITNTGENPANNIIVKSVNSQWKSSITKSKNLGKLNNGDFTGFAFSGIPNDKKIQFDISYTDIGGVRRNIIENVNIGDIKIAPEENTEFGYLDALMFLVGIFVGIFIIIGSRKIYYKKRGN